ncbi:MAG: hypothetical protein D6722_00250 [Bacteroidetes bacterium]|nr:MAG: hypothetical protein D6722_00250 [Bacteroidota bacterium]
MHPSPLPRLALVLLLLPTLALQGCFKDSCNMTYTYMKYSPVYMSPADFLSAVKVEPPQPVTEPGKIYLQDQFLLVNEPGKGVHIFDNQNPEAPEALAYLRVPGTYDLAMNCDKLYLDSSTDLLVFDLSNPAVPVLLRRVPNAFPHMLTYRGFTADPNKGVVVAWEPSLESSEYDCNEGIPWEWELNQVDPADLTLDNNGTARMSNPAVAGQAGSMSRFTVLEDYLYIVTPQTLQTYDVTTCETPIRMGETQVGFWMGEAEMVSTLDQYLLIGTNMGMHIFDATNPVEPQHLSRFDHVEACDPVVGQGNYAYVTLRNGSDQPCGPNFTNQLDVVDISQIEFPRLVVSVPMTNPHGLGIDGNLLFIADGEAGLRIFDASDPQQIGDAQIAHFPDMQGYDVIASEGILTFVGADGISLYDYTEPTNVRLLSTIPTE